VEQARNLIADEITRSGISVPDPGSSSSSGSCKSLADVQNLKHLFPFLKGFSDNFLMSTNTGELMKIESTALKLRDAEKSKDAVDRLTANKSALVSTFYKVKEGKDNRWDHLDDSRCLPPCSFSCQTVAQGKRFYSPHRLPPSSLL